jgi:hypothetical protein
MTITETPDIRQRIAKAIGRAITTRQIGETVVVSLPVMYPSGTFAGIHVTVSGDNCFVSDSAIGLREAEMRVRVIFLTQRLVTPLSGSA